MPELTIIIPLYNHQDYIAKALDSVFMQKTSYEYKVIVADDCSIDNSLNIVKDYAAKHKNLIIMESKSNQKAFKNLLRAYKIIDTKYFCVLDSDDFYTDSNLIQNALNFLESNSEFSIYCCDTMMSYENSAKNRRYICHDKPQDASFTDFLQKGCILGHTSATFYRNLAFGKNMNPKVLNLPENMSEDSFRGESFRLLSHLNKGKIHYEPKVASTYRVHNKGIWQGLDSLSQSFLNMNFYKDMWLYFDKKYPSLLAKSYNLYKEIFSNDGFIKALLTALSNESLRKDLLIKFQTLKNLHYIFMENASLLDSKNLDSKPKKLKYRILKNLYLKLDKKLLKKGLIKKPKDINLEKIFD